MLNKTWVEISRDNILHNIKSLKSLLKPETKFMAVLKSNAYGHGLEEMNTICVQSDLVDWFGVDSLHEALILRKLENNKPILVLGYVPYERMGEAIDSEISVVAYNKELLDHLDTIGYQVTDSKKLKIHIKVETGTSRQGIAGEELLEFVKKANQNPNILIEGIYTHFANIEDTTNPSYAMEQLTKFNESVKKIEELGINIPIKHSTCSGALLNYPETHFDMARAGCAFYGYWPSPETRATARERGVDIELRPALTWKTKIVQIKKLKANTPISYGLTETLKRDSKVAILPIGYWDGYDRKLSSIGEVTIHGKQAKVLGRVCMNMTMVDITDIPEAKLFDEVILLGNEITVEEIAKKIGTINYEIVTRINPLIKRVIV